MPNQSQSERILAHLKSWGSITQMECLDKYQCMRLASRISDLRQDGHIIDTVMFETSTGKRVAKYILGQKQKILFQE